MLRSMWSRALPAWENYRSTVFLDGAILLIPKTRWEAG